MLFRACVAAATAALLVSACGSKSDDQKATQVAVKVNNEEISVHQVNTQLARSAASGMNEEQQAALKKRIVEGLVDQQLLVEKALENKLDRDPQVLAALQAARQQVLAQAYVQKKILPNARPGDEEIRQYYSANPALFGERKVYRLQELASDLPVNRLADLEAEFAKKPTFQQVAEWLQSNGYRFSANAAVRPAEQLPLSTLPRVSSMKDGEMAAFNDGTKVTIVQIVATQPQPLSEKDATPFIDQYLTGRKREELVLAEVKNLRQQAKIEYVGAAADMAPAGGEAKAGEARTDEAKAGEGTAPRPAASQPSAQASAPPASTEQTKDVSGSDSAVSKGVSGLR